MRPVNLIPVEDRRDGARPPLRGGPLAYVVLAALLAALVGVVLLVVANNQISDRESERTTLQAETTAAQAEASRLAAYTQFHAVRDQRTLTVANLADSRFDWQRVMRELSLVLPTDVWLTNLTGTVRPNVSVGGGESISLRSSVAGPALEMIGCAGGQEAVARFVTVLKDIDGVTRVGVQSSELPAGGGGASESGSDSGSVSANGTCQTRDFIAQFQIVVAFDAAPVPAAASGEGAVAVEPAPEEEAPAAPAETTAAPEGE